MNETDLHDRDFYLWLQKQSRAIALRDTDNMDWNNLLEEIEDMGASQKRALRSYYYKLAEHILKLRDWRAEKERNARAWRAEIVNFRRSIKDILEDSPSLKNYLKENHIAWFNKVTDDLEKKQLFNLEDITAISLTQMMDDNFFGVD